MLKTLMLILQDLRKVHYGKTQYDFFCFCFVNNIIQKQVDVILSLGISVKPIIVFFTSFLRLGKILLYIFLIYIQSLILYSSLIEFFVFPIIIIRT